MTTELLSLLVLGLFVLVLVGVLIQARSRSQTQSVLERIETRLDEQGKRGDAEAARLAESSRATEETVRGLDEHLRARQAEAAQALLGQLGGAKQEQQKELHELRETLLERFGQLRESLANYQVSYEQRQTGAMQTLQTTLESGGDRVREQVAKALIRHSEELGKRVDALTQSTDQRLGQISGQVERRLSEGFEKTNATFRDIGERLTLIDDARKKIESLSDNVDGLQRVLSDRSARGAFGEVQLQALVQNVLPESSYKMQYELSNGKRVDCALFLPDTIGTMAIDAKFPLENYRRKIDPDLSEADRQAAEKEFARNVRGHIRDIADKYILPGETADGAMMFIPAEAVFAEIHAHHPDLVETAHRSRVWLASPTTLMAILTTVLAVIKDAATREQVHLIQEHLSVLAKDFTRFEERMDKLAVHIDLAHRDVEQVHTSARKITSRFGKIEKLELGDGAPPAIIEPPEEDLEPEEDSV